MHDGGWIAVDSAFDLFFLSLSCSLFFLCRKRDAIVERRKK